MKTGRVSRPRTVEVEDMRAFAKSTSHSGKRVQHLVEDHASFNPVERGPETGVDAVPEAKLLSCHRGTSCRGRGS